MLGTAPRGAGDVSCVSTYIPSGSPIQERVGGRHLWNAHLHSRVTSFPDLRCRGTEPSLLAPGNQCVFSKQSAFGLRWSQLLVPPTGWRKSSIRLGPGVAQRMSHKASVINRGRRETHSISYQYMRGQPSSNACNQDANAF